MTHVHLALNAQALRKSLRYAFASHDACVKELIQNGRRAGATRIDISYDESTQELTIVDNGEGVADFQTLMTIGSSGWSDDLAEAEKPYGLGFCSAIFAAEHVSIVSRGQCLSFSTADALGDGQFALIPTGATSGTSVMLKGFIWKDAVKAVTKMASGYPTELTYNGVTLNRPNAANAEFIGSTVGLIKPQSGPYKAKNLLIYLQGFEVWCGSSRSENKTVVHLDSAKYFGKMPDRDRVIDQDQMVEAVDSVVREIFVEQLLTMKQALNPLDFCEQAHDKADSLGMLDIMNDIDVVPSSWLLQIEGQPHEAYEWNQFLSNVPESETGFSRQSFEDGQHVLAELESFATYESDGERVRWFLAKARKCLVLSVDLDEGHWARQLVGVKNDTPAEIRLGTISLTGRVPYQRTEQVGDTEIVLCDKAWVHSCGIDYELTEHFAYDGPTGDRIVILTSASSDVKVNSDVLQQLHAYFYDDQAQEDELSKDVSEVNSYLRQLTAESPSERIEMALYEALRDFSELRSMKCSITIDTFGRVKVADLVEQTPSP